jgi:hypothetical protein
VVLQSFKDKIIINIIMENITVYDDILSPTDTSKYIEMIFGMCRFFYGEVDNENTPPTGMVCDFTNMGEHIHPGIKTLLNTLLNKIYEKQPTLKDIQLYRVYVNLFTPNENPYFHIDGENTITCLYYLNPQLSYDEGGETQFIVDEDIKVVCSKPGRLAVNFLKCGTHALKSYQNTKQMPYHLATRAR